MDERVKQIIDYLKRSYDDFKNTTDPQRQKMILGKRLSLLRSLIPEVGKNKQAILKSIEEQVNYRFFEKK